MKEARLSTDGRGDVGIGGGAPAAGGGGGGALVA